MQAEQLKKQFLLFGDARVKFHKQFVVFNGRRRKQTPVLQKKGVGIIFSPVLPPGFTTLPGKGIQGYETEVQDKAQKPQCNQNYFDLFSDALR